MSGPIRDLREALATALASLGIEVFDAVPGDVVDPPAVVVGLATIGPSGTVAGLLLFTVEVTLVGERGDFLSAQYRLDDLEWSVWSALADGQGTRWSVIAEPRSLTIGGLDYPTVVYSVEAPTPC